MCIASNSVNQAQDLMFVTKFEDFPNSLIPIIYPLQEDYIIKSVDLLSGFGGTMGLWLGWSVMSLGEFIIQTLKTLKTIISFQ